MHTIQSYGNAALKLHENGYIPIPIAPSSKKPIISNWTSLKNEYDVIDQLSKRYVDAGAGVLLNDLRVFESCNSRTPLLFKNKVLVEVFSSSVWKSPKPFSAINLTKLEELILIFLFSDTFQKYIYYIFILI
tara:strand:+ start:177 stop:572 length:396 start_codon:yes stop_codon:yes gene_type:complete